MHNLKRKKYWLFDMDGTLTCAMHDFDAMRAELDLPAGKPILESLAAMEPLEASRKRQKLDAMELTMAAQARAQRGSVSLLQHLQTRGAYLGIVTRNGKLIANATLAAAGLDEYFSQETIISRDCCRAKPDPAGIEMLLQRWSANASDAVMVGDYLFDLQAGHAAGTTTVHMDVDAQFAWPEVTDHCVSSLPELHEHLI